MREQECTLEFKLSAMDLLIRFKNLRLFQKIIVVKRVGIELELERNFGQEKIQLYALKSDYAEVYLSKSGEITNIDGFSGTECLVNYLDQINIDDPLG